MTTNPFDDGNPTFTFEARTGSDGHSRTYVKMTPYGEAETDRRMRVQGLRKVRVPLPGGRWGFVWERFRGPTSEESATAQPPTAPVGMKWRTTMPTLEEQAKPTAVTPGGQILDETYDWDQVYENMHAESVKPKRKAPSDERPATPERRISILGMPSIPEEVLRAQERDGELIATQKV